MRVVAILVLHDVALVKAERSLRWHRVHLADVDRVIPIFREVLYPTVVPRFVIPENTVCVRIDPRKERGTRWRAGRRCNVHVLEHSASPHQSVQARRDHVVETHRGDRVVALLVRQDEYDVRTVWHVHPLTAPESV